MLTQEKLAIIGGYIEGDLHIRETKYNSLIETLMNDFKPELLDDCILEYRNCASTVESLNNLHSYMELLVKTSEQDIDNIYSEIFNIYNNGKVVNHKTLANLEKSTSSLISTFSENKASPVNIQSVLNIPNTAKYYSAGRNINRIIGDINYGFESGRCYVFAGLAKGGKSLFLQNLAMTLSNYNSLKLLYISLENNLRDIGVRQLEILKNSSFKNPVFDILYSPKMTLLEIEEYSKNYDVIILDYLARINPDQVHEKLDNYTLFGYFTDELHKIAEKNDIVLITASQLNRNSLNVFKNTNTYENNFLSIDQDSLADSMGIVRNADSVSIISKHEDKFYIHNIASRMKTDNEAIALDMTNYINDPKSIAISTKGVVIC